MRLFFNQHRKLFFLISILGLFCSSPLYAWSNYFRFINNFNFPMVVTITPALANVTNPCGSLNNIEIGPQSASCEMEFNIAKRNGIEQGNNGTITLAKKDDPNSYCVYRYDYTYQIIPYNYFDIRSEKFSLQSCHGRLKPNEISVINDAVNALPRPLAGNLILSLDKEKAAKSTESFSQADCGINSGDNCIIASPDLNTSYLDNGSTLAQSIHLQTQLDRFEPLNFAQFIGSHNSAISSHYTTSKNAYNMSYSDPDHFMSLTDQLNSGVRQIELDIEWYKNAITLCHDHVSAALEGILCNNNAPISTALTEIRAWVEKNPHDFVIIYLDVNLPLTGYINDLDNELAKLDPYVFTPDMAQTYYHTAPNTLPAYLLAKNDIITIFKKNIIITNDDDMDHLKDSRYVFVKVLNSNAKPLDESGVDAVLRLKNLSRNDPEKYSKVKTLYDDDPLHYNIFRANESRTVIEYFSTAEDKAPNEIVDYLTTLNIPTVISYPINIFSTSMLGYTCNTSSCDAHPTDPRIFSFLWSWNLGYPLQQNGSHIAYINPKTAHFENDILIPHQIYSVLCLKKTSSQPTPTTSLEWYLQTIKITDPSLAYIAANFMCENTGGLFAAPTTAYWMSDVMSVINADSINPYNVIINYQNINGEWIPNAHQQQNQWVGKNLG